MTKTHHESAIGCHDPDCTEDADVLARDTMVKCTIGFCDDDAPEWLSLDHIEEVGA